MLLGRKMDGEAGQFERAGGEGRDRALHTNDAPLPQFADARSGSRTHEALQQARRRLLQDQAGIDSVWEIGNLCRPWIADGQWMPAQSLENLLRGCLRLDRTPDVQ